jgi:hypothetical protein
MGSQGALQKKRVGSRMWRGRCNYGAFCADFVWKEDEVSSRMCLQTVSREIYRYMVNISQTLIWDRRHVFRIRLFVVCDVDVTKQVRVRIELEEEI